MILGVHQEGVYRIIHRETTWVKGVGTSSLLRSKDWSAPIVFHVSYTINEKM